MRIAHISDLHLREKMPGSSVFWWRRSRSMTAYFRRAVEIITQQLKADVLVVTGDLLDVPFYAMEQLAGGTLSQQLRCDIEADYRLVKSVLDSTCLPYIVLAGNHDEAELLEEVFCDQADLSTVGGVSFVRFWRDTERSDHYPWRDLSAYQNVAVPGSFASAIVHVQHYVVTPECNQDYPHTYANASEIMKWNAANGSPVLSLSGHFHPGTPPSRINDTVYSVAAAFCEHPHPWYVYDLSESGLLQSPVQHNLSFADQNPGGIRPVELNEALESERSQFGSHKVAVYTRRPLGEETCDALWHALVLKGLDATGVYSLADEREFRRFCVGLSSR